MKSIIYLYFKKYILYVKLRGWVWHKDRLSINKIWYMDKKLLNKEITWTLFFYIFFILPKIKNYPSDILETLLVEVYGR